MFCNFAYDGVKYIVCCVFVLFVFVLGTLCQFLWIFPSVASNVYSKLKCFSSKDTFSTDTRNITVMLYIISMMTHLCDCLLEYSARYHIPHVFFSFFLILNHHAVDMLLVSKIRFSEVRNCACHFSAWREMMTNHGTAVDAVAVSWCCCCWM